MGCGGTGNSLILWQIKNETDNSSGWRVKLWLHNHRSSTRFSFVLQIVCRVLFSVFSLLWTPLLLGSMGKALNGLFLSFQSLTTLGGLGDLGMGGLVNIQTSRLLGRGDERELKEFLAAARAMFVVMAILAVGVFVVIWPKAVAAIGFLGVDGAGSMMWLGWVGAAMVGLLILSSYTTNLNYGCGNLLWPVLPSFLIMQFGFLGHWLLARAHYPLWVQCLPYAVGSLAALFMSAWFVRLSHPELAFLKPLLFEWQRFRSLTVQSFWVYLSYVASGIYLTISRLLISAGFGPAMVPVYQYNYRLCELLSFFITTASLASLPKITQWWSSADAETRDRGRRETERLNKFQTFLGCSAALIYLVVNDLFVRLWLGRDFQSPLAWQAAFAASVGVMAAGQAGFDMASRCSERGIRVSGATALLTALLNLGLSWLAVRRGSIFGVALSAVVAQSINALCVGWFTSRQMRLSWWRLVVRNWLLALGMVGLGVATRWIFSTGTYWSAAGMLLADALALIFVARIVGIRWQDLQQEKMIFQSLLKSRAK